MPGYIPFVTPINAVFEVWYLLVIPLSFGISMIYKAMRVPTGRAYWFQVGVMTLQVVLAMIALAVALGVFVEWVVPMMRVA